MFSKNNNKSVQRVENTLFAILRSALGTEKLSAPVSLAPEQWKRLASLSVGQNVGALVFEELGLVGNDMPGQIRAEWAEYASFCAKRFDAQLMALTRIGAVLNAENVRVMVLKGMGLALAYPRPELRECGDIDIYCFNDYDKVNELAISRGLSEEARETEEKHFGFTVSGIEVENHKKFLTDKNRANSRIGKILKDMSGEEQMSEPLLPGLLFPSPKMGTLHLVSHTLLHLEWSGITLRHLCDVTMYFRKYASQTDVSGLRKVLAEAGEEKAAVLIFDICNKYLGMGFDLSGWTEADLRNEEAVLSGIFHPFVNSCFTSDPFRKLYRKVNMHLFRKRMYFIVYGEKYPQRFLDSFVFLKGR